MDPVKNANDIFSFVLSTLSGGIINDVKTAIFGVLAVMLIGMGLDLIITKVFGMSISERLEFNEYRYQRRKKENFERWYEAEENKHLPVGPEKPRKNYLD